jgi:hypothetical protein
MILLTGVPIDTKAVLATYERRFRQRDSTNIITDGIFVHEWNESLTLASIETNFDP